MTGNEVAARAVRPLSQSAWAQKLTPVQKAALSLAERVFATFWQSFAAAFVVTDLSTAKMAALAGVAAAWSTVKNLAGTYLGNPNTPSWLPAAADPATPTGTQAVLVPDPLPVADAEDPLAGDNAMVRLAPGEYVVQRDPGMVAPEGRAADLPAAPAPLPAENVGGGAPAAVNGPPVAEEVLAPYVQREGEN